MRILRKGYTGEDVAKVQNMINKIGFDCGNIDGVFGIKTEKTVKEFQTAFGLRIDGKIGPETYEVISKLDKVNHFKVDEFRCKHCKKLKLDIELLLKLEELRKSIEDKPIIINSGYRCPIYNKNVDGAKNSQHLYGRAADIIVKGLSAKELGIYTNKVFSKGGVGYGSTFIHVDTRDKRARWSYL